MSNALCRLLDNRWMVLVHRGVDGRYYAYAKKPFRQTWADVLPQWEPDTDMFNNPILVKESDGIPSQCASGDTPDAALSELCDKVFGLEASNAEA